LVPWFLCLVSLFPTPGFKNTFYFQSVPFGFCFHPKGSPRPFCQFLPFVGGAPRPAIFHYFLCCAPPLSPWFGVFLAFLGFFFFFLCLVFVSVFPTWSFGWPGTFFSPLGGPRVVCPPLKVFFSCHSLWRFLRQTGFFNPGAPVGFYGVA